MYRKVNHLHKYKYPLLLRLFSQIGQQSDIFFKVFIEIICYNIASVLCLWVFGWRHLGDLNSLTRNETPHLLHWKAKS